ncbi:hypothetical protein C5612_03375 [Pseudomonas frederiksbergensis]|uniref:Uncharacterized protein n=1 Tax=Pseudomonas frederiksbergensis TaxID=104087 RepID=A0A2S8HTC3_9PSED|nr:hypothetical protein [Pseudomonas frederiksbergensis]PQP05689.1 hypothetical protein C5612_03375 [Pseudomonas frederiksbergensis]
MSTIHRFNFPVETKLAAQKLSSDLDLHVSVGEILKFAVLPDQYWKITQKIYTVSADNSVDYVDYKTIEVEDPYA